MRYLLIPKRYSAGMVEKMQHRICQEKKTGMKRKSSRSLSSLRRCGSKPVYMCSDKLLSYGLYDKCCHFEERHAFNVGKNRKLHNF